MAATEAARLAARIEARARAGGPAECREIEALASEIERVSFALTRILISD